MALDDEWIPIKNIYTTRIEGKFLPKRIPGTGRTSPYQGLFGSEPHGGAYEVEDQLAELIARFHALPLYTLPGGGYGPVSPAQSLAKLRAATAFRESFAGLPSSIKATIGEADRVSEDLVSGTFRLSQRGGRSALDAALRRQVGGGRGGNRATVDAILRQQAKMRRLSHASGTQDLRLGDESYDITSGQVEDVISYLSAHYNERFTEARRQYELNRASLNDVLGRIPFAKDQFERTELYRRRGILYRRQGEFLGTSRHMRNELSDLNSMMRGLTGAGPMSDATNRTGAFYQEARSDLGAIELERMRNATFQRNKFLELHMKGIVHDYMGGPDNGMPGNPFLTTNAMHRGEEYEVRRIIAAGEQRFPGAENISEWGDLPAQVKARIPYSSGPLGASFEIPRAQVTEAVLRPRSMAGDTMMKAISYGGGGLSFDQMRAEINMAGGKVFSPIEENALRQLTKSQYNLMNGDFISAQRGMGGTFMDKSAINAEEAISQINRRISQTLRYHIRQVTGDRNIPVNRDYLRGLLSEEGLAPDANELLGHVFSNVLYHHGTGKEAWERWQRPLKEIFDNSYSPELKSAFYDVLGIHPSEILDQGGRRIKTKELIKLVERRAQERAHEWGLPSSPQEWNKAINTQKAVMQREGMVTHDIESPMQALLEGRGTSSFESSAPPGAMETDTRSLIDKYFTTEGAQDYRELRAADRLFKEKYIETNDPLWLRRSARVQSKITELEQLAGDQGDFISQMGTSFGARVPGPNTINDEANLIAHLTGMDPHDTEDLKRFLSSQTGAIGKAETPFFGATGHVVENLETFMEHGQATGFNMRLNIPGMGEESSFSIPARIRRMQTLERGDTGAKRLGIHFELGGTSNERKEAITRLLASRGVSGPELEEQVASYLATGLAPYQEFTMGTLAQSFSRKVESPGRRSLKQLLDRARSLGMKDIDAPITERNRRARNIMQAAKQQYDGGLLDDEQYAAKVLEAQALQERVERISIKLGDIASGRYRDVGVITALDEEVRQKWAEDLRTRGFGTAADRLLETGNVTPYDINEFGQGVEVLRAVAPSEYADVFNPAQYVTVAQANNVLEDAANLAPNTVHIRRHLLDMANAEPNVPLTTISNRLNERFLPTIPGAQVSDPEVQELYANVLNDLDKALRRRYGSSIEELQEMTSAFAGDEIVGSYDVVKSIFGRFSAEKAEGIAYNRVRAPLAAGTRISLPGMDPEKGGTTTLADLISQLAHFRKSLNDPEARSVVERAYFPRANEPYSAVLEATAQGLADYSEKLMSYAPHIPEVGPGRTIGRRLRSRIKDREVDPASQQYIDAARRRAGIETHARGVEETAGSVAEEAVAQTVQAAKKTSFGDVYRAVMDSPEGALGKVAIGAAVVGGLGIARMLLQRRNKTTNADSVGGPSNLPGGNPYTQDIPYTYPLPPASPYATGETGVTYIVNARGVSNPQQTIQGMSSITGSNPTGVVYYAPHRPYASYQDDPDLQQILR